MKKIIIGLISLITAFSVLAPILNWDPSPDIVDGYRIYYHTNTFGNTETNLITFSEMFDAGNATSATINNTNFRIGIPYYFVATAYVVNGTNFLESVPSNEVMWTNKIRAPQNLRVASPQ